MIMIRKMTATDIAAVQQIATESWHATYEGILPRAIQDSFLQLAYNDEQMNKRLQQSMMYVAEMAGEIVGFANYVQLETPTIVELSAIYLAPVAQGQGIGTALLQKGIADLPNAKEIVLSVEKENIVGMNFYNAKGFEMIEEFEEEYEGHTLQTVRMVLKVL